MCYFDLPSLQKNINPLAIFCDYAGKKKPHLAEGERNWVCKCKLKTNKEEKPEPPTFLGEAILKIEARMISECCNTTGDLNFQSWTKATDSSPWFASAARPAALSASQKRRVNIGADVPATHLEPWNSKINCAIHFFPPKHTRQEEHSRRRSGLSGNHLPPFTPAWLRQQCGAASDCSHREEAQRVSCNWGEPIPKEHLPVFFFFYRRLKIKHFLLKPVICIITLSRWSFTWTEVSTHWNFNKMHELLIIEYDFFPHKVLCSWTPRFVMKSKILLVTWVFFN